MRATIEYAEGAQAQIHYRQGTLHSYFKPSGLLPRMVRAFIFRAMVPDMRAEVQFHAHVGLELPRSCATSDDGVHMRHARTRCTVRGSRGVPRPLGNAVFLHESCSRCSAQARDSLHMPFCSRCSAQARDSLHMRFCAHLGSMGVARRPQRSEQRHFCETSHAKRPSRRPTTPTTPFF